MNGNKRQCTASFKPGAEKAEFVCQGKNSPDEKLRAELERAVQVIAMQYPPAVLDTLLTGGVEFTGPASGASVRPALLRATTNSGAYQFQIGNDNMPEWIGYSGPDKNTWTVEFASYIESFSFPMKMVVRDSMNTSNTQFAFNSVDARK